MKKNILPVFMALFFFFGNISTPSAQTTPCYINTGIQFDPDTATPFSLSGITNDDQYSPVISIGFNFCFFGTYYTQVVISSNAYLSFNPAYASGFSPWYIPVTPAVPSATLPMNCAFMAWSDLYPPAGGSIKYKIIGTAPYRKFIVFYDHVPYFTPGICVGNFFTGQIILCESTNSVEMHILDKPICAAWNGGRAVQGVQNSMGMAAVAVPGRNATQWSTASEGSIISPVCQCPNQAGENIISGKVYRDDNANCIFDGTDIGFANAYVRLDPWPLYYTTDALGNYVMHVDTGSFNVSQVPVAYRTQLCPAADYPVTFSTTPLTFPNADFADSLEHCHDITVGLTSGLQRVCRSNNLYVQCCNYGPYPAYNVFFTIVLEDSTYLVSPLNYIANPAPLTYQFALGTLQPNQCVNFTIQDSVDCAVPLGRILCFSAYVTADSLDCDIYNNSDGDCRNAVNSYDPNDKQVASQNFSQNGYVVQENITANDTLTYVIRFQNTGNDVAYNVVIMDTISQYLDLGTIDVIGASHSYIMTLNEHIVIIAFNNIMLPDSNTNEPASHGMIKFKIRQRPGNQPGTVIYNSASIFFDLNPPIYTNQTENIIPFSGGTSVENISADGEIKIYPNPFSDYTTLVISGSRSNNNIKEKIKCSDLLGREIPLDISLQSASVNQTVLRINRGQLNNGIYFLRINTIKPLTAKLVISH
ncbi:MAG TPA: T9SS type A sorting domain-containing protein [Bacteroidia bacterium]|nr:T9SS type A sorting domain-containing protein [Bacteroidia bacterium]